MILLTLIVFISAILISAMIFLKVREVESGERNAFLGFMAHKLDPVVGKTMIISRVLSAEVMGNIIRFLAAKIGLWTARGLFSLRNFSSKLASHIYHTSRKAESGDPAASHPSFFIKAILEFRDKMREEKKDK